MNMIKTGKVRPAQYCDTHRVVSDCDATNYKLLAIMRIHVTLYYAILRR